MRDRLSSTAAKDVRLAGHDDPAANGEAARRRAARLARAAASPDPERLVFIDETWAPTALSRRNGRARRGAWVVGVLTRGHCKSTTLSPRFVPMASPRHACSMAQSTAPASWPRPSGCSRQPCGPATSWSWDTLGALKAEGVRIEAAGDELLYLSPYSPDLNPIEQGFAKLKAMLRSTAARMVDLLGTASARSSMPAWRSSWRMRR